MLRDPSTPNDLKLQGFAAVLVKEWVLANPNLKVDSTIYFSRSLNCTYSKVVRVSSYVNSKDHLMDENKCTKTCNYHFSMGLKRTKTELTISSLLDGHTSVRMYFIRSEKKFSEL